MHFNFVKCGSVGTWELYAYTFIRSSSKQVKSQENQQYLYWFLHGTEALRERSARMFNYTGKSYVYIYIYIYMYVCMFWWLTGVESNKKIRLEAIARLVIKLHQQEHMTYPDEYTAGERVRVYICFSLSIAFVSKEKQSAFKTIQPSTILDDGVRLFLI